MQTDALSRYHGRYRLSYLVPILMWQEPVILVATEAVQQRLLMVENPAVTHLHSNLKSHPHWRSLS
jgi:ATP-dependent DNA helicase DinG